MHAPVTASRSSRIVSYLKADSISSPCIMIQKDSPGSPTHLQALRDVAVRARRVAAQVAFK